MKLFLFLFIFLIGKHSCLAQQVRDSSVPRKDSSLKKAVIKKVPATKPDSLSKRSADTIKPRVAPLTKPVVVTPRTDSISKETVDTIKPPAVSTKTPGTIDTIQSRAVLIDHKKPDLYILALRQHPYFNFLGKPRYETTIKRPNNGKDGLFYFLTGLVLYFALVRLLFSKYLSNLFAVFFRVSLKQKQIREQLLQSPLPSMLLNIFFIIAGGMYISFLLQYYNFSRVTNPWLLIIYSVMALGGVYLVKFLILKLLGWMFNISEATDTYIFVIFLVNKLLGILLVPFLVLLAFSSIELTTILVTLSFTMVAILFAYRYIISYAPVRKEIKVSQFHFFLYLCAFEIIPLLLIYKVLLTFLEKNS